MTPRVDPVDASGRARFEVPPFPMPVRAAVRSWKVLARAGLGLPSLQEASLIAAARRRTGLEHFVDERFREGMRRLLFSLEEEAELHPLGRAVLRSSIIRALECRLRHEHLCDLYPEIALRPVEKPVFIAGLQRTGTTMLHRLLGADRRLRPLSSSEALNPAPLGRPVAFDPAGEKRRMAHAVRAENGMRYLSPALFAIHPVEADAPEEDVFLLDVTFVSGAVDASLRVPSYTKWIREADAAPPYAYFRRLIQLLLWQKPGRYLGKTPHHLENLETLVDTFPDAKIIHTHRDPRKVVPSFCSMMAHTGVLLSERRDWNEVGQRVYAQMSRSIEAGMAARERMSGSAILDVHYADLMRDPLKEMRRIYDFVELEFDGPAEEAMKAWLAANPKDKNGAHPYSLREFGLDTKAVDQRFERYRERFSIERESNA